jgi:hypothetical protein
MSNIILHENFQYFVRKYGPPTDVVAATEEQLNELTKIVPSTYVDFIRVYGFGRYYDGLFQMCRPYEMKAVTDIIFAGDPQIDPEDVHVVGYNAFGELYCWTGAFYKIRVTLATGMVFSHALTWPNWKPEITPEQAVSYILPVQEDVDFEDHLCEPMYVRCQTQYGKLEPGECYGFFPALAVSGIFSPMRSVEHIKRVKALEHFTILAQMGEFYLTDTDGEKFVAIRPIGS